MTHPKGFVDLQANGASYRLHVGFSVLADLQAKHGQDVLQSLSPPPDAPEGWMPPLAIVIDLFLGALQRHHAEQADRWLADDLIAQNPGAFSQLLAATFPDAKPAPGNAKGPRRAA